MNGIVNNKKRYRWFVCVGCFIAIFCTGGLSKTGFSVYQSYLISHGGLGDFQASMLVTLHSVFSVVAFLLVTAIYKKTELRLATGLAVFGIGCSFILYGLAHSFPAYCAAAALAGFSYGVGGLVPASILIHRWFDDHAGLALGICMSGSGLSSAIATPLITNMIEGHSLQYAFLAEAVIVVILAVLTFALLRNFPEGAEPEKNTNSYDEGKAEKESPYIFGGWIRYLLSFSVLILGLGAVAVAHMSVLFKELNFTAAQISFLLALMGLVLCFGKCIYGFAVDKLGSFHAGNLFYSVLTISLICCCCSAAGGIKVAALAMVLYGLGAPTLSVGISIVAKAVAKPKYYATVVRQFQVIFIGGGVVFGFVPGAIADLTGSYMPTFVLMTVLMTGAAIMIQVVSWMAENRNI